MPHKSDDAVVERIGAWFDANGRDLPWRSGATPWGVLVSEVMLQQTPVSRVAPAWATWMERWPTPAALAAADQADVLRAWGRLGYPRRAKRLRDCAAAIVADHGGEVPSSEVELLALPGVGEYTAAAVAAFGFGSRAVVLDTNVRRVIARVWGGSPLPPGHMTVRERERAERLVPQDAAKAARWNVAAMELGALVCTARAPRCDECPVANACAWLAVGKPGLADAPRRSQPWHGTDRQVRGRIMAILRAADAPVAIAGRAELADVEPGQLDACLESLVDDGLVREAEQGRGRYSL